MAWKQRMIAAYHREEPDHVPWSALPRRGTTGIL